MIQPIAITPGEPAGIGPDIVLRWFARGTDRPFFVIANLEMLRQRAEQLNLTLDIRALDDQSLADLTFQVGTLWVLNVAIAQPVVPGTLAVANAAYVIATLDLAIDLALAGQVSALVTGPVQKSIISDAGFPFSGHTEYLRDRCDVDEVVMMLATDGLRVALVTTHLPLSAVSAAIDQAKIKRVTRILFRSLVEDFGCAAPRILVSGLNPHAGEGGHLGREEIDTIIPALTALAQEGIATLGPLPADTLFQPHYLEQTDAVLAMYHDQGLPVLKYRGFGNAVNITLGLPFIRTSVDHGTALDLAGSGQADLGSLEVALQSALDMAEQREQQHA
ncbi:4-hydroxythreonine-4-phosphate dehydrogenase PdxA [Reinekea sp.]|uniref:4-hydroxythreonine-4-phosphate dehydrogenase PdxA n=1 Tax=Reinekea sp. TaxID=1970455 RepID=UPI0039C24CF3